jgi:TPR repeat protein
VETQDDECAAWWYRRSAEQGNPAAQANLGYMFETGRGVEQSYEDALGWYRKAAAEGDEGSQKAVTEIEEWLTANRKGERGNW